MSHTLARSFVCLLALTGIDCTSAQNPPSRPATLSAASSRTPSPAPRFIVPSSCSNRFQMAKALPVLAQKDHPCHGWLSVVSGRVISLATSINGPLKSKGGSGAIWTRTSPGKLGIILSALHNLSPSFQPGIPIRSELKQPDRDSGAPLVRSLSTKGLDTLCRAGFLLFVPEVPARETGQKFHAILPRHDYFLGVIEDQRLDEDVEAREDPSLSTVRLQRKPILLDDPAGLSASALAVKVPPPGARLMIMGFPQHSETPAFSVGRVLTDAEVQTTLDKLRAEGDDEGRVPYDPEAELILSARAVLGVSGSGVFDEQGAQVGIAVRASFSKTKAIVRVVRLTFVLKELRLALAKIPAMRRKALVEFLPPGI